MRIEQLRKERADGGWSVAADVIWEDRDAAKHTLTIQAVEPYAHDLEPNPNAFVLAMFPLAQWFGERRVAIDGSICCRLRDGLGAAMDLFALWYERGKPLRIEPTRGFGPTLATTPPRAACFFSGGIDALSLLRRNRLDYPPSHPEFIRDCILLFGVNSYDADAAGPRPERLEAFETHTARMSAFVEPTGATLVPMHTNIRTFYPDFATWSDVGVGAGVVSTALCLSSRIDRVTLASSGVGMSHPPHGSHPWLDHYYSTDAVAVRGGEVAMSRFEKTRLVAEWDEALTVVRSCLNHRVPARGEVNCGECEKCLRTMLALLALGKLDRAATFPFDDVTPSMLEPLRVENRLGVLFYSQCAEALQSAGRAELALPIRRKIQTYVRHERRRRVLQGMRRLIGL